MPSVAAILGAAGLGAAANSADTFFNWGISRNLNDQSQELALQRMQSEQEFNAAQAQIQRQWEERMSNTAYQRAIADMKAAGINPASIGASQAASTPNASMASAGSGSAGMANFTGSRLGSGFNNILSSALNGLISKDRDAAKYLANEIRDNAKHAHRVEEMRERLETRHHHKLLENDSLESLRHNNRLDESVSREEDKTLRRMLIEADKQRYKLELLDKKIKSLTDVERFRRYFGHKSYRD